MDESHFTLRDATVAIAGLGLMGGSLALALRDKNACRAIWGITRDPTTRAKAIQSGLVDRASPDLALAADADVIVLATPVRTILRQLALLGGIVHPGAIVIDMGSTKQEIAKAMEALPAHIQAIGAHPMCGKETYGFSAAEATLYQGAPFVLTPLKRTRPETVLTVQALALAIGARPIVLDPARHDRIVAATSHLPYVLSSTLVATAADRSRSDDKLFALAAGGFRDTSRVAASDTTMMLDILLTNRENIAALVRDAAHRLEELAGLLDAGNESDLRLCLEQSALKRREIYA